MGHITKKREVLPLINDATIALSNMSLHGAKLEYHDNDTASRDLKKAIVDFKNGPLKALEDAAKGIREEILSKPKVKVSNRPGNIQNLRQFKNK